MKISAEGAKLFHVHKHMNQHDKANNCFLQFINLPKNQNWTALVTRTSANHSTIMFSDAPTIIQNSYRHIVLFIVYEWRV
jgi:hypothetical protein